MSRSSLWLWPLVDEGEPGHSQRLAARSDRRYEAAKVATPCGAASAPIRARMLDHGDELTLDSGEGARGRTHRGYTRQSPRAPLNPSALTGSSTDRGLRPSRVEALRHRRTSLTDAQPKSRVAAAVQGESTRVARELAAGVEALRHRRTSLTDAQTNSRVAAVQDGLESTRVARELAAADPKQRGCELAAADHKQRRWEAEAVVAAELWILASTPSSWHCPL